MNARRRLVLLALVFTCARAAAAAPEPTAPMRSYALAARGPLALLLAGDAGGPHAALDTSWPLGRPLQAIRGDARDPRELRLDALVVGATRADAHRLVASELAWTARLERAGLRDGRWLGVSTGGSPEPDGARVRSRVGGGLWRWVAPFEVEGSLLTEDRHYEHDARWARAVHTRYKVGEDTLFGMRDTTLMVTEGHSVLWTTGQGSLRWRRGRVEMEAVGGLSLGRDLAPRRWAQSTLRVQLSPRWLMLASAGQRASGSLAFDAGAQPRSMVGLQFAPWATGRWAMNESLRPTPLAWKAQPLSDGRVLVRVRCRDTHQVEVAGDFTDWQPVALMSVHANWWAGVVRMEPGVHRVQVRLDGGPWMAPAGLPRSDDGPAGEAGLLVIE